MLNVETPASEKSLSQKFDGLPTLVQQVVLRLQVQANIAQDDQMFDGHERHYFGVGRSVLLSMYHLSARRSAELCGGRSADTDHHGFRLRTRRSYPVAFPQARIEVTDIREDGVEWCVSHLGCERGESISTSLRAPVKWYIRKS